MFDASLRFAMATIILATSTVAMAATVVVQTQADWEKAAQSSDGLKVVDGMLEPTQESAIFSSKLIPLGTKAKLERLVIEQSPIWQNWKAVEPVGPTNLDDAPVLLVKGPNDYWMFGRYRGSIPESFEPEDATLPGFDIPLTTTPFPRQYNAPGGLKAKSGGYHAWQSRDMKNWVHHGPVTERFSGWVTTAEYVDGKTYIYYDYPNDQDPHVYIDDDLTDGEPGKNVGKAFADPSDGSDCTVIRDEQGRFHIIYEDWSPIDASRHAWDSPLAGHAVSPDGLGDFKILAPAVDNRTKPTGRFAKYPHPHWHQHPDWTAETSFGTYEIHEPKQDAYGDWAAIRVGSRYYLFGDYHPAAGGHMSVGRFTSPSLDVPFTWCGRIGRGHPDPDIGFAEGRFYLITQVASDFVSPGPWVEAVKARVGADSDGDGTIDHWTDWQEVKETYDYVPGFAKHVARESAAVDCRTLPAAKAFAFELKLTDTTDNESKPIIDKVTLQFK